MVFGKREKKAGNAAATEDEKPAAECLDDLRDDLDDVRKPAAIDPVTKIYDHSAFDA